MKFSGHLTLKVIDEITGEVINTIEQDNIITDLTYKEKNLVSNASWSARNIFISTETATPIRSKTSIQCSGTAYQGSGQPPIQAFHNSNPPYFVITQRFDAVATARTFQTVGLTESNPGQVVNTTVTPYAYLLLNQPCTQELNQTLDLIYRITIENSPSLPNIVKPFYPRWINDVTANLIESGGRGIQRSFYLYTSTCNVPLKEFNWINLYISNYISTMSWYSNQGVTASSTDNTLFYRYRQYWQFDRTNNQQISNGKVFNGLYNGKNSFRNASSKIVESDPGSTSSATLAFQPLGYNQTVNLQSAFSYSATPPDDIGPMFLPANNPSGTGVVQFSEDPWTGTWPTIYRIKITEGGPVGTAKFVLGVKPFISFMNDPTFTYSGCYGSVHPYITSTIQPYPKAHGWQITMPIVAIDNVWTVQGDNTGVSIINQFTGQHFDFDATTTPSLPITRLRQIVVDKANNSIYVACSSTGLWRLNITNILAVTITNLSTTPTYAVDVDKNGIIYVFMNLATTTLTLTSSASNYITDLGFTGRALTTADNIYLKINKIHPDTRIAVLYRSNTNFNSELSSAYIYWWSLIGGDAGAYTTNSLFWCGESQNSVEWVRNSDSRLWTAVGGLLVYGTGNTGGIYNGYRVGVYVINSILQVDYDPENRRLLSGALLSINGGVPPNVAQDIWGNLSVSSTASIYNPSTGTAINSYNSSSNVKYTARKVDMNNGIILSNIAINVIYNNGMNNGDNKWLWYKWNGTNWIPSVTYDIATNTYANSTGTDSRLTSNSFIDLLDGINVKFTDGVSGASFVTNEVYDQYVCKGVLKTNDNTIYVESCPFYTQPVFEKITLTPTVISAANNHGIVVDGAPGNLTLSAATSSTPVNPLWYALLPDPYLNTMQFFIDGIPIENIYGNINQFCDGRNTLPAQNTLTTGQCISYRNGLVLFSTADVGKTVTGYFSYVARSD